MGGESELEARMATLRQRIGVLELLGAEGPLAPREVEAVVDYSRPTVTRALRELREADLVERRGDGYAPTAAGRLAAAEYRRYQTAIEAIAAASDVLAPIPAEHLPPVDVLVDARVITTDTAVPIRALEAVSRRVLDADRVRAYLPTLVDTHFLRVWHRAIVASEVESEAIFDPTLRAVLQGQYPQLLAEMAAAEGFTARETSGPPYAIVLGTSGADTRVTLVGYRDGTAVTGVVTNDATPAVRWARSELDRLSEEADDVTADLTGRDSTAADGLGSPVSLGGDRDPADPGRTDAATLPLDLEREGFRRLSAEYFDAHAVASPTVSWRTGFTLPEVRAGHALDRRADGRSVSRRLRSSLQGGTDHVVLGPPGSGKSTTCMAVACAWFEREVGPVLYRERGVGDGFDSAPLLEGYLRHLDGHALVVVEDAVRDQANDIFAVMQALEDADGVSFLLDARTHEWRSPEAVDIDPRRDAYRRSAVVETTMPAVDERECQRFLSHYESLVSDDVDLTGPDLFSRVTTGRTTADDDSLPPGDALVVQHALARQDTSAPVAEASPDTALEASVSRTYTSLASADVPLAADLGLLVATLAAAGIPVAPEHLAAVAAPDEFAGLDDARSLLRGRVLFDTDRPGPRSSAHRTPHETVCVRLLATYLAKEPVDRARERFGRCVSRLLALADDPARRTAIERHLGGPTPHLHRIAADPRGWATEVVDRIFAIGRTNAQLAPLYGETGDGTISLPAVCPAWTRIQTAYWRGEMNRTHGDLAAAEREFRTLEELVEAADLADDPDVEPPAPAYTATSAIQGDDVDAHRTRWRATSRTNLGVIATEEGALETAEQYHNEALARYREIDDRAGAAICLKHLGRVAFYASEYDRARSLFQEGLETARSVDARRIEFGCRMDLGAVAVRQSAFAEARDHFEATLAIARDLSDRREEAQVLNNLGVVTTYGGAYDEGRAYWEQSLAIRRELGDRQGEADSLDNLGIAARKQRDRDRAREYHREALAIRRDIGYRSGEATSLVNLGVLARDDGDQEAAAERFDAAFEIFDEIGDSKGLAEVRLERGRLALARGDREAAREHARAARDTFESLAAHLWTARSRRLLGRVAAADGDLETALDHWRTGIETAQRIGAPPDALETIAALVETCRRADEVQEARDWCRRAREILAGAPEATASDHREWVERHASELGVSS